MRFWTWLSAGGGSIQFYLLPITIIKEECSPENKTGVLLTRAGYLPWPHPHFLAGALPQRVLGTIWGILTETIREIITTETMLCTILVLWTLWVQAIVMLHVRQSCFRALWFIIDVAPLKVVFVLDIKQSS